MNKTIKKVQLEEEKIIHKQSNILNVKEFYEKLYTCADSDLININLEDIINVEIPKLEPDISSSLEAEISEKEVLEVLKYMKNNKSPGSDGFRVELFKFFWKNLKLFILNAINFIFLKKELPISQRLEIISCLPKGDKPRRSI